MNKTQSELGAVGEASPNIAMLDEIDARLRNEFVHQHGTITDRDCVFLLDQFKAGHRPARPEDDVYGSIQLTIGCTEDFLETLIEYLTRNRDMISTFMHAAMIAKL